MSGAGVGAGVGVGVGEAVGVRMFCGVSYRCYSWALVCFDSLFDVGRSVLMFVAGVPF